MSGSLGKSFQIKKYGELSCEEIQHNFCQKYKIGKKKKIIHQTGPARNGRPSFAGHLAHLLCARLGATMDLRATTAI